MKLNELMNPRKNEWGFLQLQNCILNIAAYIDKLCKDHGIEYCLMGGSALGAVRHKGFIPWDDDLDIFMRPEDYEKFRTIFLTEGDQKNFYLQEWGASKGRVVMAKLRLNGSHYVEENLEGLDIHKGVFVDIFILHSCPDNIIEHWWQYLWSRYIVIKGLANRNYKRRGIIGNIILKPLGWLPNRFLLDFSIKQIYRKAKKETNYYCHYLGRAGYRKGLYKSSQFKKTKYLPFEKIKLKVPEKVEEYLNDRWGDYMAIPSKEQIIYYQHSCDWVAEGAPDGMDKNHKYVDEYNLIG
ncbi:MAG: LicD family protein [Muribaculaceae bacterium]|nr:LicD family protein [Muribaculaceae bacterium]